MLDSLAARLEGAGHAIAWGFDGAVTLVSPGDRGWWARVDGHEVRAGSCNALERAILALCPLSPALRPPRST